MAQLTTSTLATDLSVLGQLIDQAVEVANQRRSLAVTTYLELQGFEPSHPTEACSLLLDGWTIVLLNPEGVDDENPHAWPCSYTEDVVLILSPAWEGPSLEILCDDVFEAVQVTRALELAIAQGKILAGLGQAEYPELPAVDEIDIEPDTAERNESIWTWYDIRTTSGTEAKPVRVFWSTNDDNDDGVDDGQIARAEYDFVDLAAALAWTGKSRTGGHGQEVSVTVDGEPHN